MAFVRCRPKIVKAEPIDDTKTILWANFSPQGQAFSKSVALDDIVLTDSDTFYCDVDVTNTTEETLISVGREINTRDGDTYPRSILHFLYPVSGKLNVYMSARYSGGAARRINTPIAISGNRIKIAFNKNGLVVNGVQYSISYYNEWFRFVGNDLTRPLEIGSTYGNHSNQHYNEISVLKGFLSVEEMKELTSV